MVSQYKGSKQCMYVWNDVKGVERSLNSFNVTHVTHVKRVERSLNSSNCYSCYSCWRGRNWNLTGLIVSRHMSKGSKDYIGYTNMDTFNAMSTGWKYHVMKSGHTHFLLMTYLITGLNFNPKKVVLKLRLYLYTPYHPIRCTLHVEWSIVK